MSEPGEKIQEGVYWVWSDKKGWRVCRIIQLHPDESTDNTLMATMQYQGSTRKFNRRVRAYTAHRTVRRLDDPLPAEELLKDLEERRKELSFCLEQLEGN